MSSDNAVMKKIISKLQFVDLCTVCSWRPFFTNLLIAFEVDCI